MDFEVLAVPQTILDHEHVVGRHRSINSRTAGWDGISPLHKILDKRDIYVL